MAFPSYPVITITYIFSKGLQSVLKTSSKRPSKVSHCLPSSPPPVHSMLLPRPINAYTMLFIYSLLYYFSYFLFITYSYLKFNLYYMAILRKRILGTINGKYGDTVVQHKFGKDVVSIRPEHYKPTNSQPLKNSRGRLGIGSHFASSVNGSELLRQMWHYSKIKAISPYHKCIKFNIKPSYNDAPSPNNIITPLYWILPNVKAAYLNDFELHLNETSIDIRYTQSKHDNYIYIEPPYMAVILVYLIYPKGVNFVPNLSNISVRIEHTC